MPADAVDGDLSTRWSDEGDGGWLRLDLGTNRDLGAVTIAWHHGDERRPTSRCRPPTPRRRRRGRPWSGKIRAHWNGVLQSTLTKSFSGAYVKTGAYAQANCSNSSPCGTSDYGEVVVYDVTVTHS